MTQITPLIGSLQQASSVQRQQSAEKAAQLRRAADLQKDSGLTGDRFEHAVESAEELAPIHDEQKNDTGKRRSPQGHANPQEDTEEEHPGLDLTA